MRRAERQPTPPQRVGSIVMSPTQRWALNGIRPPSSRYYIRYPTHKFCNRAPPRIRWNVLPRRRWIGKPSQRLWCPRPDLNRNTRFRKPLLYPVELRGPESGLPRGKGWRTASRNHGSQRGSSLPSRDRAAEARSAPAGPYGPNRAGEVLTRSQSKVILRLAPAAPGRRPRHGGANGIFITDNEISSRVRTTILPVDNLGAATAYSQPFSK